MTASFVVGYLAGLLTMIFVVVGMAWQALRIEDAIADDDEKDGDA